MRQELPERDGLKVRVKSRGDLRGKPGGSSCRDDSLPASIRVPIMVAVIALVHDPRCTWSVTRIGSDEPILRIPRAPIAASRLPFDNRADQAREVVLVANRGEYAG